MSGPGPDNAAAQRAAAADGPGPDPDPGPGPEIFQLSGRPRYSVPDKFSWNKNGHETAFYKAKRRIDDMNLHKKTRRIQLE